MVSSPSSSSLRSLLSEIEEDDEQGACVITRPPSESSIVTPVIDNKKKSRLLASGRLNSTSPTPSTRLLYSTSVSPQRVYSIAPFTLSASPVTSRTSPPPPPPPASRPHRIATSPPDPPVRMTSKPSPEYQILVNTKYSNLWNYSLWFKLALTLDGRDKLTKLLQYLSRFGAWYLQDAPKLVRLKVALTQSRKAYRLGRTLMELEKLHQLGIFSRLKENLWDEQRVNRSVTVGMDRMILSAVRLLGMMGFWSADNLGFLASAGAIDGDKALVSRCSRFANRSYFVAAITGFYLNATELLRNRHKLLVREDSDETTRAARDKYYGVLLAMIKSTCDVLVFSNNPGVDLWQKHTGHKMNEGFHCLCGIVSASTVLCKNFPSSEPS